jgi:hypothetical protein
MAIREKYAIVSITMGSVKFTILYCTASIAHTENNEKQGKGRGKSLSLGT